MGGFSCGCPSDDVLMMYVSFFGSQAAPAVEEPKAEAAPEPSPETPETSEAKAEAVAEVKESAEASDVMW